MYPLKLLENQATISFIYLTSSSFVTISYINCWEQVNSWKISGNSGMAHFAETNHAPSPYLMLQHIARVAPPKLALRNCLRYLQRALIIGRSGVSLRIFLRCFRIPDEWWFGLFHLGLLMQKHLGCRVSCTLFMQ